MYITGAFSTYLRRNSGEKLNLTLSINLKKNFFQELLKKKISTFGEQQTGGLVQQLNREIDEIVTSITTELAGIIRGCVLATGGFVYIITTSIQLSILTLFTLSAITAFGLYYRKKLKKQKSDLRDSTRELSSFLQQKFMQIKTVKLFTAESIELVGFNKVQGNIKEKSTNLAYLSSRFYATMELIGRGSFIWIYGYGLHLVYTKTLTIGQLIAFGTYGAYTVIGFFLMLSGYTEIKKCEGLYTHVQKVIADTTENEEVLFTPTEKSKNSSGLSISLQAVSFEYPGRETPVLVDVSMNVNPGEIWGIVGQSGNGKSTIFHLITKLYTPGTGAVLIDGHDIKSKSVSWVRQFMSIVSQEALLFSTSILENIKYSCPLASKEDVDQACRRADALDFINELPEKFSTQVGENGSKLSGGQRQRIAIARALLKEPQILLLDEATSGLDRNSEAAIQTIIEREVKHKGFTVLIISHRINSLKGLVDYIAILSSGKITAAGTYEQVSSSPEFQLISRINKE